MLWLACASKPQENYRAVPVSVLQHPGLLSIWGCLLLGSDKYLSSVCIMAAEQFDGTTGLAGHCSDPLGLEEYVRVGVPRPKLAPRHLP